MTPVLNLQDVTLVRGGRMLFEGLTLGVQSGEAVQVRGPNGAGKSSLLRLAAGLLQPARGTAERAAVALADDRLALDPERPLRDALRFWGGDVDGGLNALGISHLSTVPVRLLSSGQAKRASLARLVASRAPLWLLDEPINALDTSGIDRLNAALAAHRSAGGAVVAASHQPLAGEWRTLELGA
jgi:heme exporter protein A